jgi:eukaryotic-like serine/threonine-protein kinase
VIENVLLNNRYRLLGLLATGGMGEVWQASDELLARPVAVKVLRREYASDEAARTRFKAEAQFAASLHHGGIAQVYDYGEQDDLIYLVMELVPGEPLSKILTRSGALSVEATLDLITQTARALQVAHTAGIIHRDIKPGNLMVTSDGTIKVTDFGIARAAAVSTLTQTGMVMGTAHYVSPEQASGQPITPASDLYSLGVVAFECLTGTAPFDADTPVAIALKHVRDLPPALPLEIPASVRELVRQLLAKRPTERLTSAQEVADQAYVIRESLALGIEPPAPTSSASAATGPIGTGPLGMGPLGKGPTGTGPIGPGLPAAGATALGPDGELIELAEPAALDTLLTDEVSPRRRSPLLLTSVAVGVLLLGVVVVGSLLRGPQGADLNGNDSNNVPVPVHGNQNETSAPNPIGTLSPSEDVPQPTTTRSATSNASPTARATHRPRPTRTATPSSPPVEPSGEPSSPGPSIEPTG